jgi:glycosyltransferase involved in cell wall biosynthesis
MKKIAIDCRSLQWKHSGIARYLQSVLNELFTLDSKNIYYLLSPYKLDLDSPQNFTSIQLGGNELIYKYFYTPNFLRQEKIDVYWSPTHELPLQKVAGCKYYSTIHDVAFEHDISSNTWKVRLLHMLGIYKRSAHIADLIFTDSHYSQQDIAETYGINKDSIVVTYLGVGNEFKIIDKHLAQQFVANKFSIHNPYIFYINTGRPKNLIRAFSELIKEEKNISKYTLVCLGKSALEEEQIDILAMKYSVKSRVIHIKGFVDDVVLNNLYSGAEFYVCPSFFEGFGLTPLEAIKCGTPILISNVTALPEVFKDGALYCDPSDYKSINKSMKKLSKAALQADLLKKAKKTTQKYTWEHVSKKIHMKLVA